MPEPSTASLIILELRRQVDHQLSASASVDTKAAGLIAGTFALFALVVPRVQVATLCQTIAALVTFGLVLAALSRFALATMPRIKGFSYGPEADDMLRFLDDGDPVESLEEAVAHAYAEIRSRNEGAVVAKSEALNQGIVLLVVTVIGLGAMVAVGGIT
jgi:hypothetical protein